MRWQQLRCWVPPQASIITIETECSKLDSQVDAATYQCVVDSAIASPSAGYGTATPAVSDNISNYGKLKPTINYADQTLKNSQSSNQKYD